MGVSEICHHLLFNGFLWLTCIAETRGHEVEKEASTRTITGAEVSIGLFMAAVGLLLSQSRAGSGSFSNIHGPSMGPGYIIVQGREKM
jgi:hypothetical protein